VPTTAATPSETGPDGKPLTWVGATPHSTGKPGDPTNITVAVASTNYPEDQVAAPPPFTNPFPPEFRPLLRAAEDTWELYANIKFIDAPDAPSIGQSADIRVGTALLWEPTLGSIGLTTGPYNPTSDKFLPEQLVRIEDKAHTLVTRLPDGDYQYNGGQGTVFQDLLHELGHALGLDHNPNDPNSVMSPGLGPNNPLPDAQDIAGIQAIYGAPKPHSVVPTLTSAEITTLRGLGVPVTSFA
jgi:Matrixin